MSAVTRLEWWTLENKFVDYDRKLQLVVDDREVRNEMIKMYYFEDELTCKAIGEMFGLSESGVWRIVTEEK